MPNVRPKPHWLMLMPLAALLSSCAPGLPVSSVVPEVPPLPMEARTSQVPIPSICSSGCSAGWTKLVETSADMLTHLNEPD